MPIAPFDQDALVTSPPSAARFAWLTLPVALFALVLSLVTGATLAAGLSAVAFVLASLPGHLLSETRLFARSRRARVHLDATGVHEDGALVLRRGEIRTGYVHLRERKSPAVRLFTDDPRVPQLEIDVADYSSGRAALRALGLDADEQHADFRAPAWGRATMVAVASIAAGIGIFLAAMGHRAHHGGNAPLLFTMGMVALLSLPVHLRQTVKVGPEALELSFLGRFKKRIAWKDVLRVERHEVGGLVVTRAGKLVSLTGFLQGVKVGKEAQRSSLVERAADAFDAYTEAASPNGEAARDTDRLPATVKPIGRFPLLVVSIALMLGGLGTTFFAPAHGAFALRMGALLTLIAGSLGILLSRRLPRGGRPAAVSRTPDGLRIGDREVRRELLENAYVEPQLAGSPLVRFVGRRYRDSFRVRVEDEQEGHALVRALSLDAAHSVARFSVRGGLFENRAARIAFTVLVAGGWQALLQIHGAYRWGIAGLMVLAAVNAFWPTRVSVGADGVLIAGLRGRRFHPFSRIATVERAPNGVTLKLTSRESVLIRTSPQDDRRGTYTAIREALLLRIQEGLGLGSGQGTVDAAMMLRRGGRPARAWIDQLRTLGDGAAGYRAASLNADRLWAIVEDPRAEETERAGAAVALGKALAPEDRGRLQRVAEASASPRLRVVFDAAASPEEEARLEDALDACDDPVSVKGLRASPSGVKG